MKTIKIAAIAIALFAMLPVDSAEKQMTVREKLAAKDKEIEILQIKNDAIETEIHDKQKQIDELKAKIEFLEKEIKNLRTLDTRKEEVSSQSNKNEPNIISNKLIYGIRLEESIKELAKRINIGKINNFDIQNDPVSEYWTLINCPDDIIEIQVGSYHDIIYSISISYRDTSHNNFNAIANELYRKNFDKDFTDNNLDDTRKFSIDTYNTDKTKNHIFLLKYTFRGEEKLTLSYTVDEIKRQLQNEIQTIKQLKIKNNL